MGKYIAALGSALVALALSAPAVAQGRGKFVCRAQASQMFFDGYMKEVPDLKELGLDATFTFDEATGDFYWPGIDLNISYKVLQHGSAVNGIVAVALKQGPASYSAKTLRVATWSPISAGTARLYPFMLIDEDIVSTGFCLMTT